MLAEQVIDEDLLVAGVRVAAGKHLLVELECLQEMTKMKRQVKAVRKRDFY